MVPLRIVLSLIVLWGFVFSAGCQANSVDPEEPLEVPSSPVVEPLSTSVPITPTGEETQMTPSLPTPADAGLQTLIENAKADLAQRLSISITQINLVEATETEWSDSSLGCPQPGMNYLQVITPGYLILLEVNAQIYEYHSHRDTYFVYCENPNPPSLPKP
jgi:hypothetical protein